MVTGKRNIFLIWKNISLLQGGIIEIGVFWKPRMAVMVLIPAGELKARLSAIN